MTNVWPDRNPPLIGAAPAPFKPELIAIDVDHTLITDDHRLTSATIEAVQQATRAGVHVVLASSRPPKGMDVLLGRLGLTSAAPFVSLQGGLVCQLDGDAVTVLESSPMPLEDARGVVESARRHDLTVNWYAGTSWFVSEINELIQREAGIVGFEPERANLMELEAAPEKILLMAPAGAAARIELPSGVDAQRSNPSYVEITRSGVSKASGVGHVASTHGVNLDRAVAIGDGENDLALFETVGLSIAPENAGAQIRAQASLVTKSNNADGVAFAIRALLDRT